MPPPTQTPSVGPTTTATPPTRIAHVVIIVQENRTVDNLFQLLPGANTQAWGLNSQGQRVNLVARGLVQTWDPEHAHSAFVTEYDGRKLDGWDKEPCAHGTCPPDAAYSYVPQSDVQPYYTMAEQYTFADNMLQTNQGPSFPAHQYLVSATSAISNDSPLKAAENPVPENAGGCDSRPDTTVETIDPQGDESSTVYPCFNRISLMQELDDAGISWKYYQAKPGAGLWKAPDAVRPIWSNPSDSGKVAFPPSQVLTDIVAGNLAAVTWVTPTPEESDHSRENNGTGPSWVASVVNAIGQSQYWDSTVVFVTWDDWGGWFDHVTPTIFNSYEDGFRVPLIVISPYARQGYISHVQHEFGSILKFTEETFNLPSLGFSDRRSDDLADCFNYAQARSKFKVISANPKASYFKRHHFKEAIPDE